MSPLPEFRDSALKAPDGARLFVRQLAPIGPERARVLLIHGMGEHSSRYQHVARRLSENGFGVVLFDLRGHGRSDGMRGHIESYDRLVDDVALVWDACGSEKLPAFIYGHSLGGQLALNFTWQRKPAVQGLVIASPWLALAFAPRAWKLWLARLAVRVWPQFTQGTDVRLDRLSRDLDFLTSLPDLDLVHHRMSARMFFALSQGAEDARAHAEDLHLPLLLLHGADDPVTSAAATQQFFKKVKSSDKTLLLYPAGLHETHNDLDREIVLRDVVQWLQARC